MEAARERRAQAHKALQAAERELVEAREVFFRAKARQEALEKRRDSWRGEQRALEARQEEDITADLLMARSHGARTTHSRGTTMSLESSQESTQPDAARARAPDTADTRPPQPAPPQKVHA